VTREVVKEIPAPVVERKSTVGAGDSLVAGIVAGLGRKMELEEAVRLGVACGAATVMNPGTELCHQKDVYDLFTRTLFERDPAGTRKVPEPGSLGTFPG